MTGFPCQKYVYFKCCVISGHGNAHCNAPDQRQFSSHLVGTLGSQSQFTYICAGLSLPLNVETNRSWCWQSLLSTLGGGTATSVPTTVTTIVDEESREYVTIKMHKRFYFVQLPFSRASASVIFNLKSCKFYKVF